PVILSDVAPFPPNHLIAAINALTLLHHLGDSPRPLTTSATLYRGFHHTVASFWVKTAEIQPALKLPLLLGAHLRFVTIAPPAVWAVARAITPLLADPPTLLLHAHLLVKQSVPETGSAPEHDDSSAPFHRLPRWDSPSQKLTDTWQSHQWATAGFAHHETLAIDAPCDAKTHTLFAARSHLAVQAADKQLIEATSATSAVAVSFLVALHALIDALVQ